MRYSLASCVVLVACNTAEPRWSAVPPVAIAPGASVTVNLAEYVDDPDGLVFSAVADAGVSVSLTGSRLTVTAASGWDGTTSVALTATRKNSSATTTLVVTVDPLLADPCPTTFSYIARSGADRVFLAGSFNGWSETATPMEKLGDGWGVTLDLVPGAHTYKIVESVGGNLLWSCDPGNGAFQCDPGYQWDASCPVGGAGCNSLIVVGDCSVPELTLDVLDIDREAGAITAAVTATGEVVDPWATLDGSALADAWTGVGFDVSLTGLTDGRHTLRFGGNDASGAPIEEIYIPVWTDERSWDTGLLYFAFVDRFANGDPALDADEGETSVSGGYFGGDWQGVIDQLDYLDDLGVTAIWLTAPLDNPQGAFNGDCGMTYTGYHGYWPTSESALEEHFGDEDALRALVAGAHARGIRVLVDLVANHVHEDHAWMVDHPDWFNDRYICMEDEDGNGQQNWDQRPETCWFASYLPDIDYYRADAQLAVVDAAVDMVVDYGFDGLRVDAVKHMPHSFHATLQDRVARDIEHAEAGGDEPFYTVGETFTGDRGLIAAYVNDQELDGQFDFPLYWGILGAFARDEIGLSNGPGSLMDVRAQSEATWGDATMSVFLGNHDVARFVAHANDEIASLYGDGACNADGSPRTPDAPPSGAEPYDRLQLAWSFLLTSRGLPLVYYGDEIGLPGYGDPDNRQMMRFGSDLSADESRVLAHVQALGQARREHPAMALGTTVGWWENEPDVYAYARAYEGDAVLVLLNRSPSERILSNGVAFAGLPQGAYVDVLTGDRFTTSGDSLTVAIPGRRSRVLVPE